MFVCHSLGGLVTKQVLRLADESREEDVHAIAKACRGVLFLATPHLGVKLATLTDTFQVIFGATVTLEDLREHGADLEDLANSYIGLAEDPPHSNGGVLRDAGLQGFPHRERDLRSTGCRQSSRASR